MNQIEVRSALQDALEEEIPSSQVNLWPSVEANLVAGNTNRVQQGAKMKSKRQPRISRLAFVAAILVALLAAALFTPQGRVLSQSILQFFTQAEATTVPLPSPRISSGEPDPLAPTAEPPAPLTSVDVAEAQLGFDVAELPSVPDGLTYLGARLYGNAVSIEYQTEGYDGHLIITQSQHGFMQSDWDQVPAGAVLPVKIGELDGEFTSGSFVVYAGETVGTWNPNAHILRLRWVEDGVWFEITRYGNAEAIAYLDQAGLVELAESLVTRP